MITLENRNMMLENTLIIIPSLITTIIILAYFLPNFITFFIRALFLNKIRLSYASFCYSVPFPLQVL